MSIVAAVALLCGIFGTWTAYAAEKESGNYFYFCMEYADLNEEAEKEIYMNPVKIYQNGFYDLNGDFVRFDTEINTAAEAVNAILTYYKDKEMPMTDDGKILNDFYNEGGSYFRSFKIDKKNINDPAALYNNSSSQGLNKYGWVSAEIAIQCGDVFRIIFDKDMSIHYGGYSSPASDELVGAIADYYEARANKKASKAADKAYEAAISGYFDEKQQETLVNSLNNALKGETKKYEAKLESVSLENNGGVLSGSVTGVINCSVSDNKAAAVILAIFDNNNKLVYFDSKPKTLSEGRNSAEFDNVSAKTGGAYTIKLFAWESSAASMHPRSNCAAETK